MKNSNNFTPPPKKITQNLISIILIGLLLIFSNSAIITYASSQALSSEYQNSELKNDYIGFMTYQVPGDWKFDDTQYDNTLSRSYIISQGNVFQISYMPLVNETDFGNDYSAASTIIDSYADGLLGYNELSRDETTIGGYPALVVSYTTESSQGSLIYAYSVGVFTNDGAYSFSVAIGSAYRDVNLEDDILNYTLSSINTVSYSDQEIVKDIQNKLNSLGYNCGTPDGIAGNGTQSAIKQYRSDNGLPDGTEIDADLLNSLNEVSLDSENDTSSDNQVSSEKEVPISLKFGELLDANPNGGANMNTLVIKAKIEPNLTNQMTITQNYQNVIHMVKDGDYTQYDAISYWAVADMADGSEGKVISFTIDKSCIEAIANGTIATGDTLEEHLTDLWILPSLQEN